MVNDPIINSANFTLNEWLLTSKPGLFGLIGGWANPTGVALMAILCVIVFCSQAFVRRSGFFEVNPEVNALQKHILIVVTYATNGINTSYTNCIQHFFYVHAKPIYIFYFILLT